MESTTQRVLLILGSYQSGQLGLTVNQLSDDFGSSNLSLPTIKHSIGQLPEWSIGADCKSAASASGVRISHCPSQTHLICPCGAAVAHSLGKTVVMGSIPITGSCGL